MKKRILFSAGALVGIVLIGIVIYMNMYTTLSKQINKNMGTQKTWQIISVEKMESDKKPIVHDINSKNKMYMGLLGQIKQLKLKRERKELGMEIEEPLYTITVSSEDDYTTYTVNDKGEIHDNQTDITYSILNKNSRLYETLKEIHKITE